MPIQTSILAPGAGLELDYTVANAEGALVDISGWTITGTLLSVPDGASLGALNITGVDANTWRARVTGAQTTALAGKKALAKVTGVDPANTTVPVVQERLLLVGSL